MTLNKRKIKTVSEAAVAEPEPTVMATETAEAMDAHSIAPMAPNIPPGEILKISEMLQDTFRGEIAGLVESVVEGVLKGLQDQITTLDNSNKKLNKENTSLLARVAAFT